MTVDVTLSEDFPWFDPVGHGVSRLRVRAKSTRQSFGVQPPADDSARLGIIAL
jgi:hypothetical protein